MRQPLRRPFLIGAVVSAFLCNVVWLVWNAQSAPSNSDFDLKLQFDRGQLESAVVEKIDEATTGKAATEQVWSSREYGISMLQTETASDVLVAIASKCDLRKWAIDGALHGNVAWLKVRSSDLDKPKFNCISEFTRSPFARFVPETAF